MKWTDREKNSPKQPHTHRHTHNPSNKINNQQMPSLKTNKIPQNNNNQAINFT